MEQAMSNEDLEDLRTGRRKFKKGKKFNNAGEAINWLSEGKSIYIRDKFQHFGWALGFHLRYLINEVNQGVVYQAIKKEQ